MPAPTETHSQSQSTDSTDRKDKSQTALTVDSGVFDDCVIPPSHDVRTVVLCIDGTASNLFDGADSNVIRFYKMLKNDKIHQVVQYQPGIGTDSESEIKLWSSMDKLTDKAIAHHLDTQVMDGYKFLMENYHEGDKICLFGFSRGAYTARALAGMINRVGLLRARDSDDQNVSIAYKLYCEKKWDECATFKASESSINVKIEFVGVWDTVSSVGLWPRFLPHTASNNCIRHFRHAVSLDEHRAKFRSNLFKTNVSEHDAGHDVQEVWFAGCHTDIGGGAVESGPRNNLSRIPLRWMIRQCFLTNTGIQFKRETFIPIGLDPATLFPKVAPRPKQLKPTASYVAELKASTSLVSHHTHDDQVPVQASPKAACNFISEEHEELLDALGPLNDTLGSWFSLWWTLEAIPFIRYKQDTNDPNNNSRWSAYHWPNFGKERHIPKSVPDPKNKEKKKKVLVHRSVRTRKDAESLKGGKYEPKVKLEGYEIDWVEWVE